MWHSRGTSHHLPLPFLFPTRGGLTSPPHPTTAIPCMWHLKEAHNPPPHAVGSETHGVTTQSRGFEGDLQDVPQQKAAGCRPSPHPHTQPYSQTSTRRHRATQTHEAGDSTTSGHQGFECISSSSPLPSHHRLPTMSQQPHAPTGRVSIHETCKGGPVGSGAGGCVRTHLKHARLFGRAGRAVVPGNSHLCFKGRGWKEDGERIAVL